MVMQIHNFVSPHLKFLKGLFLSTDFYVWHWQKSPTAAELSTMRQDFHICVIGYQNRLVKFLAMPDAAGLHCVYCLNSRVKAQVHPHLQLSFVCQDGPRGERERERERERGGGGGGGREREWRKGGRKGGREEGREGERGRVFLTPWNSLIRLSLITTYLQCSTYPHGHPSVVINIVCPSILILSHLPTWREVWVLCVCVCVCVCVGGGGGGGGGGHVGGVERWTNRLPRSLCNLGLTLPLPAPQARGWRPSLL